MSSPQSRLRHAVPTTSRWLFTVLSWNMCIEVFLSGISFEQSFYSRLVAIPVNILIAWPYGMYRDLSCVHEKLSLLAGYKESGPYPG
ncbi:L-alanine exporter AlaE [Escherichia coli]